MNKIYKVVWSKVKNCYVVVSEIAKNVITGGVKSAKVGRTPLANGMALGALMAFVITGQAWAAQVVDQDLIVNQNQTITTDSFNDGTFGTGNRTVALGYTSGNNNTVTIGADTTLKLVNGYANATRSYGIVVHNPVNGASLDISGGVNSVVDLDVEVANRAQGVRNNYNGTLNINVGLLDVNVKMTGDSDVTYGMDVWQGSTTNINTDTKGTTTFYVEAAKGSVYGIQGWNDGGVYSNADGEKVPYSNDNAVVNINDLDLTVKSTHQNSSQTERDEGAIVLRGINLHETNMNLVGDTTKITLTNDGKYLRSAIVALQGNHSDAPTVLNFNAATTTLKATGGEGNNSVVGVSASGGSSQINFNGDSVLVDIDGGNANVIGVNAQYKGNTVSGLDKTNIKVDVESKTGEKVVGIGSFIYDNDSAGNIDFAGDTTVMAKNNGSGSALGVYAEYGGNVTLDGDVVYIDVSGSSNDMSGVYVRNETRKSDEQLGESKVTLGNAGSNVTVKVNSTNGDVQGLWASKYTATGHNNEYNSLQDTKAAVINVKGKDVLIDVATTGSGNASAVFAASKTENGVTQEANKSKISIEADNTTINVKAASGVAEAIIAHSDSVVDITKGNLYVTANDGKGYVVSTRGNADVKLGCAGKETQLNGDILFDYASNGGKNIDSKVDVTLDGVNSWFTGKIKKDNEIPTGANSDVTGMTIALSNGAKWNVTDDSFVNVLDGTKGFINKTEDAPGTVTVTIYNHGDNKIHDGEGIYSGVALTNNDLTIGEGVNLVVDTYETSIYNNNVKINSLGDVTIKSKHDDGICAYGEVGIAAKNVTIEAFDNGIKTSSLHDTGEENQNGQERVGYGKVTIQAVKNVVIKSTEHGEGYALTNNGGDINITAGNDVELVSYDRPAVRAAYGNTEANIDVTGKNITITGVARNHEDGEFNPSIIYAQGTGIIKFSATENITITDTAKIGGNAVAAYDDGIVTIKDAANVVLNSKVYATGDGSEVNFTDVGNLSITEANEHGITINNGGEVNIVANNVELTTGKAGVEATNGDRVDIAATNVTFKSGGAYVNSEKGGAVHITNETEAGSVVSIKASENVELISTDRYAINNRSKQKGLVEVIGKNVTLISENRTAVKAGGHVGNEGLNGTVTIGNEITETITIKGRAQNIYKNTEPNEHKSSVVYAQGGTVNLSATDNIEITNTGNNVGKTIAVYDGGTVNVKDAENLVIDGEVYATGDGSVSITDVGNVSITSTEGSAINNASKGSVISIGNETTKNLTITGATEGSRKVYDGQGNFVNYNEDNRAVIYSKGTVNITANEKVVIDDTGDKTKAVSAYGDANVTIDGGEQTIINGEITADGYGPVMQIYGNVEHQDNDIADNINVVIKGKDIVVDASLEAEEGVFARGDSTGIDNAVIIVGDTNTEKVTVRDVDTGLFAWNGGSKVEVNSDSLVISADGNFKDSGMGICAINSSNANNKLAIVDVNAGKTEITVKDGAFAYGIYANGKSNVDVAGNIDIVATGTSAFGVEAEDGAIVELGSVNSTVTFTVSADKLDYVGESRAEAIAARENNSVTVLGNMNATVNGRDWVSGVESEDGSVVELGNVTLNVSTNGNEFSDASGINVAREGAVNVNGNLEATVTGGEWASGVEAYNGSNINIGNGSSEVKLTATAKGTESSDKDWGVSAFGILSVGQTKPIIADNEEDSEEAHGGSTVNINASQLTINATSSYGEAYGIYTADAGVVNIENATDAEINGKVFATGESSQVNFTNSGDVNITESKEHGIAVNNGGKVDVTAENVTIDSLKAAIWMEKNSGEESKSEVHITANGDVQLTSKDRFAINNESQNNGIVNVSGKDVTIIAEKMPAIKVGERVYSEGYNGIINVTGETIKIEGAAHDVIEDWEQRAFVVYAEGGNINLNATEEIKITDTAKVNGNAIGAYNAAVINVGNAAVEINGNVYANGEGSRVNIEANKGSVNGNVEAEDNASIVVTLESKEASFTGATKVTNAEKGVTLNLQQGATWYVTGDSTVSSVIGDEFNITKATGVNEEVTVTLDGRHADDIADDYDSTTSTITGVDLVLHEDNGLNGNQTIISDSDVTLHSEGNGINVANGNYVTIEAAELTIDVTANYGQAYGIYAQDKGNVKANGAVNITATGYSAYGVEAVAGSTVEIGSSDKDVTFTITSTGVDSNLEDKEYPEAQAISAEGGSKVTVNANKLGIITTANNKVTGSLQARDKDSEITIKATGVNVKGDIFAGEGAKVAINTTTFATEGIIGSKGVIDITTGDVAYGAGTQFYTEGIGAINLAGGNVSGVLNIAKGNVNLTGATFTVANLNDAIKGAGKLVVDGSGVLKTTADQVFTVGDAETVDVETLGKNGINDIAKEKVTFKSGSLSLSDDYSYDYLTSITDVMKEDNGNATKLVMTGTLKNATSINPDDIETDENNQLDVNDASNLGSDVHLDNVTVKTDNNLLIGGDASESNPVEVDGVEAKDSVANGFSADGLDLGQADGAIITGDEEVTLGGSKGNENIVSNKKGTSTLVVGTGSDDSKGKGTLNIGTNNDASYKHNGKVHVNHGSDLNTKGKTKITDGVELQGGNLNVDKEGHLEADITVESQGNGNNGNNGNVNGKDKDKVTITGKVTGNLKVKDNNGNNSDKPEGHPSTMIHLGNDKIAGKLHAQTAELNGATLFLDPENASNISEASMFTLANADTLDGNYVAGKNSVIAFGVSSEADVEKAFAKTGLSFGNEGDVDAVIFVAGTTDVASGSITADGELTSGAGTTIVGSQGAVNFAAGSLLIVDAEKVKDKAAITGVKDATIDGTAKLYIDEAKKGEFYTILQGANGVTVDESWDAKNISTNNKLIKFTDANVNADGKIELKAEVQKVNDVYKGEVVAGEVVDKAIDTNSSSADFFNSAVDQKVNVDKASQVDGVNSSLAINEVAGVTHTTYAVSNILTDAVADHMSLANGKDHDKDIWAHYVHTKENVDGLKRAGTYDAQYNGIVVGTDLYNEGKATVGAALAYVDGNINGSSVAARTENDAKYYGASVYGSIQNDDTAVIADVSYLHGEHDITQRNSGKVITGEPETDAFSVGVRVEKEAKAGIGKLVPYAGLRYMHLGTGNYTNSIGLAYDADDAELFLLPVGLKYSADIKNTNGWTMRPVVEFGYVWAFGDTDADQTVSLNGASNGFGYDVTDSGSYVGRFMLEAEKANISYALGYEYQKGDNVEADKWMVNVNWKF